MLTNQKTVSMLFTLCLSIPLGCSLIWAVTLLFVRNSCDSAKYVYGHGLLIIALLLGNELLYYNHYYHIVGYTQCIYGAALTSMIPFFRIFMIKLLSSEKVSRSCWRMFAPAIAIFCILLVDFLVMSPDERVNYVHQFMYHERGYQLYNTPAFILSRIVSKMTRVVFLFQSILAYREGMKYARDYNRAIENYYSDDINGKLIRNLDVISRCLLIFVVIFNFTIQILHPYFSNRLVTCIPYLMLGIFVHILSMKVLERRFSVQQFVSDIQKDSSADSTPLDATPEVAGQIILSGQTQFYANSEALTKLCHRVTAVVESEKLFTHKELRIADLSRRLGTNRTYISNAINQVLGVSFSEMINRYRTEYAKGILLAKPKIPLAEVADEAGFSSESTFYRIFKEATGLSPVVWRRANDVAAMRENATLQVEPTAMNIPNPTKSNWGGNLFIIKEMALIVRTSATCVLLS